MKKLIKILMVSMICLGLTACGEKKAAKAETTDDVAKICLLYTSPSPRDRG